MIKFKKHNIDIYLGQLTIELYIPKVLNTNTDIGIFLPTQISYKKNNKHNEWYFKRAFVIKILGFGFGLAWKHCDNPNHPNFMNY